jgi:signal transduction histidine kinase
MSLGAEASDVFGEEQIEIAHEIAVQLAIAIQQTRLHQQVAQHAVELETRVAARTAELQAANERLQILSRLKDDFVSNVSHELRTPITNIKLQLYLSGKRPDQRDRYDAVLRREVDRFENLIEGLLTLSRLDQGRQQFKFEPVDLPELLAEFVADREALAETEGITLSLEPGEMVASIEGDRRLLEQVLSILTTNALAYTPAGGQITVSVLQRDVDGRLWAGFSVCDTGLGISADEIERLFERFFRGTAGHGSQVSGTGLGLSIAKEIVDRHKGQIEVHSDGQPGKGSTFTVWLPGSTAS